LAEPEQPAERQPTEHHQAQIAAGKVAVTAGRAAVTAVRQAIVPASLLFRLIFPRRRYLLGVVDHDTPPGPPTRVGTVSPVTRVSILSATLRFHIVDAEPPAIQKVSYQHVADVYVSWQVRT
jgi:hypothetical protein